MKTIELLGDSLQIIRLFPDRARHAVGGQFYRLQEGKDPTNWKPFSTIGPGVREMRVREESGAFRAIYLMTISDAVYVLHAFQKKTQKTVKHEIETARMRFRALTSKGGS